MLGHHGTASGQHCDPIAMLRRPGHIPAFTSAATRAGAFLLPSLVLWCAQESMAEEHGMNVRRACLAVLILAPWLALAAAMLVGYELLLGHRPLRLMGGCAALGVACMGGLATYWFLKTRPAASRAEVVGRLQRRGWLPQVPGLRPPFGA